MTKAKKEETKPTPKPTTEKAEKKERQPAKPLFGEAKEQLDAIGIGALAFIKAVHAAKLVPARHLYESKKWLNEQYRVETSSRKVDPQARKRASLEKRIAEAKAKLAELEEDVVVGLAS